MLACDGRVARVAELLIPIDEAKQAGISADELLGYISANFTAAVVQPEVNDVKAIVCFLYESDQCAVKVFGSTPTENGVLALELALEQGELPFQDAYCQTDDTSFEMPQLSVEDEADVFLSDIFSFEPLNVSTPVQSTKTASLMIRKAKRRVVSHHKRGLKRTVRKVTSAALQAQLKEFAREHVDILHPALDVHNVAWLNCHSDMHHMVLREALQLYQHRMTRERVNYPQKMLSYYLSKVMCIHE